jgi:ATP-dependent exoDNAse (exonuclease V) alpha subunit
VKPVAHAIHGQGWETIGRAATSSAVKELAKAGLTRTETLQGFALNGQVDPNKRYVFVIDEMSLTSTQQLYRIAIEKGLLRPQDRVLLAGDTRQHQSIQAGRIFQEFQDAGVPGTNT